MSDSQVNQKMAQGAVWMVAFMWVVRGLGFVSTLILVRLLGPEDFGMVAMAMSFLIMAELLSAFGFDIAIIHDQKATKADFDTAWSAEVVLGLLIGLIMWAAAYPISLFYEQPELVALISVLAISPVAFGFRNIGVVAFRKELEFHKEFLFQVSIKVVSFVVVIPLAYILRSYWALVVGMVTSKVVGTVLSYWVHPFRPSFTFLRIRRLISFSGWLLINNVVNYLKERSTDFFIGKMYGPSALGIYNIGYEFSNIPVSEIGSPINRALLPGFAKLQNDRNAVVASFNQVIGLLAVICIPAGVGLSMVAPIFVPVVFGEAWLSVVPIMEILGLNSVFIVFHGTVVTLLIAIGRTRVVTIANAFFVAVLFVSLFLLVPEHAGRGAAISVAIAAISSTPVYLWCLHRCLAIGVRHYLSIIMRPLLAGIVMAVPVRTFLEHEAAEMTDNGVLILLIAVGIGGVAYTCCLWAFWLLFGRPEGAESLVYGKLRERFVT
ncbi:MAG: lipopolysaccharide biosynthesis protein [Roseibium album]|uniref:lipopolysaccharide biosynthesis protein n=1 Tax=Roseibium album TaxID=311410 RepID=UPI0032ECE6D6